MCVFWKDKDDEDDKDIEDVEQQDVEMEEDEDDDKDEEDNDDVDVAPSIFECYLDAFVFHHATPALPVGNISNWLWVPEIISVNCLKHYSDDVIAITLSVLQNSICDNSMTNKTHIMNLYNFCLPLFNRQWTFQMVLLVFQPSFHLFSFFYLIWHIQNLNNVIHTFISFHLTFYPLQGFF